MARQSWAHRVKKPKAKWSMTVMMNARDLSRDDDFLSHLLVEHLGTDDNPLQVHKMDPSRRLPKHDPAEVLAIVKKYVVRRGGSSTSAHRVKRAVDALLELNAVKQYLHKRSSAQINAFATHASRYFELYLPTGSIEISHTSRYSHRTGKSELCILATTSLKVGQVISDLKGSLAHLTAEEDEELKKTDSRRRDGGIRRDFSVIHSNQKNKSHLFLGPARFVNHDCDHNVELFRDGRVITFRVLKPISAVGKGNRHCLCQTCERLRRGGYTPVEANSDDEVEDDSSTDEETREERIRAGLGLTAKGNPNERRTRRGVYAILPEEDTDDEDRVGATETVASQVPVPTVENGIKDGRVDNDITSETAVEIAVSSLNLNSSATSSAKPSSTLVPGDSLPKHPDGHLSDTSSALSSLSDGEKTAPGAADPSAPCDSQHSQPRMPISSPSAESSSSTPSIRQPASESNVSITTTPATSRMSTRSSTASQRKDKSSLDDGSRAKDSEAPSPSGGEKRALRSSCVPIQLQAKKDGKAQPNHFVGQYTGLGSSQGRRTRHSLLSESSIPVGSAPCNPERRSISLGSKLPTKGSKSDSTTPSVETPHVAQKPHPYVPRCNTCATELPHLTSANSPKKAVHSCVRCKRHFAIFSAPWPVRTTLETLSLTPSSLGSSSNETAIDVSHEKLTESSVLGHKSKHSKYVEVKQISMERPVKRRKTDPALFAKTGLHHVADRSRRSSRQFDSSGRAKKYMGYSHKKFTIPGGSQRSRANRALDKLTAKGPDSLTSPSGTRRKSEDTLGNQGDRDSSRKRPWDDGIDLAGSRTIRHVGSFPLLPVVKHHAVLYTRPSPNLFARKAWAAPCFNGSEPADEESSMETSSYLSDLTEPEQTPPPTPSPKAAPKATSTALPNPDQSGQKRKREPTAAERKKMGKTFYMKDEKKPMPKGWVLVTDSSEETGEDDEEAASAEAHNANEPLSGVSQLAPQATGVDQVADSPLSASTSSLVHTPSSRATSTPTQSSGTLVDDQAATPGADKQVLIAYSLRDNSHTPSTVQSLKRRKLNEEAGVELTRDSSRQVSANPLSEPGSEIYEHSHDLGVKTDQKSATSPNDSPFNSSALFSEGDRPGNRDAEQKVPDDLEHYSSQLLDNTIAAGQVSIAALESQRSNTSLLEKLDALILPTMMEVPNATAHHTAVEVSNIIHGTAFSFGFPDARSTWRPKYHFSELHGWTSDLESCL